MKTTVKQHMRLGKIFVHKHARNLPLKFYSMKDKKKFTTDQYTIKTKSGRQFAIAKGPSGGDCYRVMSSKPVVVKSEMWDQNDYDNMGMAPEDFRRKRDADKTDIDRYEYAQMLKGLRKGD